MKTVKQLREERAKNVARMDAIVAAAHNENRELSKDAAQEFDTCDGRVKALDAQIKRAVRMEELALVKARADAGNGSGDDPSEKEKKDLSKYSLHKLIRSHMGSRHVLDGLEMEMHQEAEREMRAAGITPKGNGLLIPGKLIRMKRAVEQRDQLKGTAANGGYLVATEVGPLVEYLKPKLVSERLGATMLTGLVGDLTLPRGNARATATWRSAEGVAATETTNTLNQISLSPKALSAFTEVSHELLNQSSIDAELLTIKMLREAVEIAVDNAVINGSGSSGQPTGILNTVGIGSVAGGANGAVPTWANVVALESALHAANALLGNLAYLTTPGLRGKLKTVTKDSGSGQFIATGMPGNGGMVESNGYQMDASSLVPSNLTKGSSSGVCHALIFANWQELLLANWGGMELIVNPYSRDTEALVRISIHTWWDIALRHVESFAAMQDALTA